jgi:hypothetical protein
MRTLRIRSYTELRTLDHKGLSNTPPLDAERLW